MHFIKGNTRFVVIIPEWRIVIKVARIRVMPVIRHILRMVRRPKNIPEYIRIERSTKWWYWSSSIKQPLFAGLMENLGEYGLYRKTQLKILQPTYFSIGFINIQKYTTPLGCNAAMGFWKLMTEVIGWNRIGFDHHHFSNPTNFAVEDGKLTVLDYGNPRTKKILFRCGDKIWNNFDVNKIAKTL